MDMLDGETRVHDYALERQMMLSDGVFAIALTLLALDLKAPPGWDHTIGGLLNGEGGAFFAYFWSFFSIAIFWASHRQMYGRFVRTDFLLSALGLLGLGLITLIPFVTRLYSEAVRELKVVALYVGLLGAVGLSNAASWLYATSRPDLLRGDLGPRVRWVVAAILGLAPPLITGIGVLTWLPGLTWLILLMPLAASAPAIGRRWAARADAAHAEAAAHG